MAFYDLLKGTDPENKFIALAYGRHLVTGWTPKAKVVGSSPSHVLTLQQVLGVGEWDSIENAYYSGLRIDPAKWKLHPGKAAPARTLRTYTADNTTDVLTDNANGLANDDEIIFVPGDLPTGISPWAVYYVITATTNTFQISTTPGGAAVNFTTNGTGTLKYFKNDGNQGIDSVFNTDVPHNRVAWARVELPSGVGPDNPKNSAPSGFTCIAKTKKVQDYDSSGNPSGSPIYSSNPALIVADLIITQGGRPTSRIDWTSWTTWKNYCDATISFDYTAIPDLRGFGLEARYYSGVNFNTLKETRIEPYVEFPSSSGGPSIAAGVDNFSAIFEGYVRPDYTGTWTFKVTATHGARLTVNGTVLINQFATDGSTTCGTQTGTISLTARQFYTIKLEWNHTTGNADVLLKWSHASRPEEVLPDVNLFPRTVSRPRYEAHPFWSQPTRLDDAIRQVLLLCNSTYQESDGKLKFFAYDQLTSSSFSFTAANMLDDVTFTPRDPATLRNYWQAAMRDIDSQFLEPPLVPITYELDDLVQLAKRRISGESIEFFNTTRHQAYRVLKAIAERATKAKWTITFSGNSDTYKVLAGDRVVVDVEFLNMTAAAALVVESRDQSAEQTADERRFILREWV